MKTPVSKLARVALAIPVLVILLGCARAPLAAEPKPEASPVAAAAGAATGAKEADPEAVLAAKPPNGALPQNYKPSESLAEIIKLAQAGLSEEVLLAYIKNSTNAFNPSPEDIIFLNDLGVSEAVITALIDAGKGTPAGKVEAKPSPSEPVAQAPVETVLQEPPVVVAPNAPPATFVTPPAEVATVSYFYDTLAPYGSWINISGYGWCWQPTVALVNVSWRPYFDRGHWIHSNHGWYWHSDYSWGSTAFHYGRWHHHSHRGWVWVPDLVWGPAWVSWRYSNTHCGWAPLPPAARFHHGVGFSYHGGHVGFGFEFGLGFHHYSFVPISRFCDRNPRHHVVAADRTRTIYNNTTVINNYVSGNNNTVINRSISRDAIAKVTTTKIRDVVIRDTQRITSGTPERIVRERDQEVIHRPVLTKGNVSRVSAELRRARAPQPSTGRATVTATRASPTIPPSTVRPGDTTGRGQTGVTRGAESPAVKPGAAKSTTKAVQPERTVTQPPRAAIPAPPPKPAITDQRMSRERLNQLVEEARTKQREREAAPEKGPSIIIQRSRDAAAPPTVTPPASRVPDSRPPARVVVPRQEPPPTPRPAPFQPSQPQRTAPAQPTQPQRAVPTQPAQPQRSAPAQPERAVPSQRFEAPERRPAVPPPSQYQRTPNYPPPQATPQPRGEPSRQAPPPQYRGGGEPQRQAPANTGRQSGGDRGRSDDSGRGRSDGNPSKTKEK